MSAGFSDTSIYDILGRKPVHPFPARMAPGLAVNLIGKSKKPLCILDPMMGSGTVVALARAAGHRAIGIDIDPLAVLIAKAWTTVVNPTLVRVKAVSVLRSAKRKLKTLPDRLAYPRGADSETRQFINYWFDIRARRQLAALALTIERVRDEKIRTVLWCAFSRLIISKQAGVSRARDLAHSRPHRSFKTGPIKPFASYLTAVERVLENSLSRRARSNGLRVSIKLGDARQTKVRSSSVDLVLTSPPYLNAIDYLRCSKFSLVWMGCKTTEIRGLRSQSVGTEVGMYEPRPETVQIIKKIGLSKKLSARHRAILARFIEDMKEAIDEVSRVLRPRGKAVYVVGENIINGNFIPNAKIIVALAQSAGLYLKRRSTRTLPPNRRYLPPPSAGNKQDALDSRMRREVVLQFYKRTAAP